MIVVPPSGARRAESPPPDRVTLLRDAGLERDFLRDGREEIERTLAPSREWCLLYSCWYGPSWFDPPAHRPSEGVGRWVIRPPRGPPAGLAEIYAVDSRSLGGVGRLYHLRILVLHRSRGRGVGALACIGALARFWRERPDEPVTVHTGGWTQPEGDSAMGLFRAPCFMAVQVGLRELCAPLRAARRALAWALARAPRRGGGHPLAAFFRRYPGLLRPVGLRVLAFWCYSDADPYARALYRALYPLLPRRAAMAARAR